MATKAMSAFVSRGIRGAHLPASFSGGVCDIARVVAQDSPYVDGTLYGQGGRSAASSSLRHGQHHQRRGLCRISASGRRSSGRNCSSPDRSAAVACGPAIAAAPKVVPLRASAGSIADASFAQQRATFAAGPKPKKNKHAKAANTARNGNGGASIKKSKNKKKGGGRQGKQRRGSEEGIVEWPSSGSKKRRPPRTPKFMIPNDANREVPPLFLAATASPNAFIASCAAEEHDVDPRSVFYDCVAGGDGGEEEGSPAAGRGARPATFQDSAFEYVSPIAFGGELPDFGVPEVAFLGRSNVGKSSLINALTGRNDLARISKRPGRTQQVNYFALVKNAKVKREGKRGDAEFRPADATGFLVDLPGYGYAEAPEEEIVAWQRRTQDFLAARRDAGAMCRTYILLDARHGPADFDRAVMGWFDEAGIPYGCILTKADQVGRPQVVRWSNDVCMRYHEQRHGDGMAGVMSPVVHVTSSNKREGIEELMWSIEDDFETGREAMKVAKGRDGWGRLAVDGLADEEDLEGESLFTEDSDEEDDIFDDDEDDTAQDGDDDLTEDDEACDFDDKR